MQSANKFQRLKTRVCFALAGVTAYAFALSGEGVGFADSAGQVVVVDLIVDVIDGPKLDYVNDQVNDHERDSARESRA